MTHTRTVGKKADHLEVAVVHEWQVPLQPQSGHSVLTLKSVRIFCVSLIASDALDLVGFNNRFVMYPPRESLFQPKGAARMVHCRIVRDLQTPFLLRAKINLIEGTVSSLEVGSIRRSDCTRAPHLPAVLVHRLILGCTPGEAYVGMKWLLRESLCESVEHGASCCFAYERRKGGADIKVHLPGKCNDARVWSRQGQRTFWLGIES